VWVTNQSQVYKLLPDSCCLLQQAELEDNRTEIIEKKKKKVTGEEKEKDKKGRKGDNWERDEKDVSKACTVVWPRRNDHNRAKDGAQHRALVLARSHTNKLCIHKKKSSNSQVVIPSGDYKPILNSHSATKRRVCADHYDVTITVALQGSSVQLSTA
jgi:hypothetical protein